MKMNKQDLMDMHAIQALTDADMQKVNQAILAQINSDVPMVNQLGFYIVQGCTWFPFLCIFFTLIA